jgi:hypothetical protein
MLKHVRDLPKLSQLVIDKLGDHTVQVLNSYMAIMHVTKSPGPSPNKSPASKAAPLQYAGDFAPLAQFDSGAVTADVAPMTPGIDDEILDHESSEDSSSFWEELTQRSDKAGEDKEVSKNNEKDGEDSEASQDNEKGSGLYSECSQDNEKAGEDSEVSQDNEKAGEDNNVSQDNEKAGDNGELTLSQLAAAMSSESEPDGHVWVNLVPLLPLPPPPSLFIKQMFDAATKKNRHLPFLNCLGHVPLPSGSLRNLKSG